MRYVSPASVQRIVVCFFFNYLEALFFTDFFACPDVIANKDTQGKTLRGELPGPPVK